MIQQSYPGHISRQNCNSKRHMNPYIHNSTIHNSQKNGNDPCVHRQCLHYGVVHIYNGVLLDVVHIYNGMLLDHIRNEIMSFAATWMQLEIITLNEVIQRKTNTKLHHLYSMWNLNYNTNNPIYETETESQTEKVDWWLPRGRGVGEAWSGSLGLIDANWCI